MKISSEALDAIDDILAMPGIVLLPVPPDIVPGWVDLARQQLVTRAATFDLQLVATMLGNGVQTIYTFDATAFQKVGQLDVRTP